MPFPDMTKYVYKIRCSNGAIVDSLQIYGKTEDDARAKLMQMYNRDIIRARLGERPFTRV